MAMNERTGIRGAIGPGAAPLGASHTASPGASHGLPAAAIGNAPALKIWTHHPAATDQPPLILLPGVGTDDRLFQAQRSIFPQLTVPRWIEPRRNETLADYGRRLAEQVDPGRECFVGGASLGGMVALEMARHLDTRACFLISSVRSRRELPWKYRWLVPLASALPGVCTDLAGLGARVALACTRRFRRPGGQESPLEYIASEQGRFLRWAGVAMLRWNPPADAFDFPILHIHGDADTTLQHHLTTPDRLVSGGRHILPLTHPWQVNQFLQDGLSRYGRTPDEA
jgi:pimeloyl-ACP methyl ester carboxylesterase